MLFSFSSFGLETRTTEEVFRDGFVVVVVRSLSAQTKSGAKRKAPKTRIRRVPFAASLTRQTASTASKCDAFPFHLSGITSLVCKRGIEGDNTVALDEVRY